MPSMQSLEKKLKQIEKDYKRETTWLKKQLKHKGCQYCDFHEDTPASCDIAHQCNHPLSPKEKMSWGNSDPYLSSDHLYKKPPKWCPLTTS